MAYGSASSGTRPCQRPPNSPLLLWNFLSVTHEGQRQNAWERPVPLLGGCGRSHFRKRLMPFIAFLTETSPVGNVWDIEIMLLLCHHWMSSMVIHTRPMSCKGWTTTIFFRRRTQTWPSFRMIVPWQKQFTEASCTPFSLYLAVVNHSKIFQADDSCCVIGNRLGVTLKLLPPFPEKCDVEKWYVSSPMTVSLWNAACTMVYLRSNHGFFGAAFCTHPGIIAVNEVGGNIDMILGFLCSCSGGVLPNVRVV